MKKLKHKSIKSTLLLFILLLIIGIAILCSSVPAVVNLIKGPVAWEDVDFSKDIEGLYVKGTVYFIYDPYAQETDNGNVTAYEYIIDADDTYYMGLRVKSSDFDKSEALLEASYDYMDGLDDGTELLKYQYEVTGTIQKMPSDSRSLYNDYLNDCGLNALEQSYFLPYYLEVGSVGSHNTFSLFFFLIIGLAITGIAIYIMVRAASGKCQKTINQYIASSTNPPAATEKVESFLATAPALHGLQFDHNFICGQNGATTIFGETPKLIWAYKYTINHKRYFITVSKTHSVMLAFTDGSRQQFNVKKENQADEILAMLSQLCPKAIIGYNDQLEGMFRQNLRGFLDLRYYAVQEEAPVEETPAEETTSEY